MPLDIGVHKSRAMTGVVDTVVSLSTGAAIVIGAVAGLVLGILVSVTTALPLAPEVGLLLGAFGGWVFYREAS